MRDNIDDRPKYQQLKLALIDRISSNQYESGDRIPSQAELEREFEVSRITVRRATADLMLAGYLEHLPGKKGVFVSKQASRESGVRTIAVAIDDVTDRFGATILRGIEDYLWQQKYHTIICNADRDYQKVEEYFNSFDYH
jgi:DNA-binding GntR family transcriptional regulator